LTSSVLGGDTRLPQISYGDRARIGMLLPSANQAAEPQFTAMLPRGVSLHTTRLPLAGGTEPELLNMAHGVEAAACLVADADVDLVLFHCTAVSTYSRELEQNILARIKSATGRPATATSQALVAALRAVGACRITMLSPYGDAINRREAAFLQSFGFHVVRNVGLGCSTASEMMAISPEAWLRFALEQQDTEAEAVVVSCTTVRIADAVNALEAQLDRPVITSNTAALWHCLRVLGIQDSVSGFGRLLERPGVGKPHSTP
jgi:maleate isomerase